MTELNFLDHNLNCMPNDLQLNELQLNPNDMSKWKRTSVDTNVIWSDVDRIFKYSQTSEEQVHHTQSIEVPIQTNEAGNISNIDALDVSLKSNESFESLGVSLNLSHIEQAPKNGISKKKI